MHILYIMCYNGARYALRDVGEKLVCKVHILYVLYMAGFRRARGIQNHIHSTKYVMQSLCSTQHEYTIVIHLALCNGCCHDTIYRITITCTV